MAATLLGAAAGMRTLTPPAVMLSRGRLCADPRIRNVALVAAAGELIADKLPFAPARTKKVSYLARIASAAVCGQAVAGPRGAASAAAACTLATQAGYRARMAAGAKLKAALAEDALAVAGAALGSRLGAGWFEASPARAPHDSPGPIPGSWRIRVPYRKAEP